LHRKDTSRRSGIRIRRETAMRKCLRCGTEMVEGWNVKEDGHKHEIIIDNGGSFVRGDGRMGILKAAVCPQCGEVSVYVDDPDTVINGWR